jgi:hypothetical protein
MKIRYTNTIEDFVAFNWYHVRHSPTSRRSIALGTWGVPAAALFAGATSAVVEESPLALLPTAVFALLWAVTFPLVFPLGLKRQVRRMYRLGQNRGALGPRELELAGDRLVERTPYGEQSVLLPAVEKVVPTDNYTFIYISAVAAHVIPRDAVTEGDYSAFVDLVDRQSARARDRCDVNGG